MRIEVVRYTKEKIPDVVAFEHALWKEEAFWNWEIDENYRKKVEQSFEQSVFANSISLLAYDGGRVVGRIDSSMIASHFDGSVEAYLDWICVIKSCRHRGVAQQLMQSLRAELKKAGVDTLVGLIAANEEAQRFYHALPRAQVRDEGIWIDIG